VIKVILKDYAKELAEKSAIFMSDLLAKNIGKSRVLGPDAPVIDKIRDLYIQEIFIKLEKGHTNLEQTKQYIAKCAQQLNLHPEFKKVKVIIDVDPV
jgi:primosomal protein N' (replication factor Y)